MLDSKNNANNANMEDNSKGLLELADCGISEDTASHFNLDVKKYVIEYPFDYLPTVGDDGQALRQKRSRSRTLKWFLKQQPTTKRFKNPDNKTLPDGKMPTLYTTDFIDLKRKVSESNRKLAIFEGDKDTWIAREANWGSQWGAYAGIFAASTPIDGDFFLTLKWLNVTYLELYLDSDDAGWAAMQRIFTESAKYNIYVSCKSIPFYINGQRTKDIGDVWKAVEFDEQRFWEAVNAFTNITFDFEGDKSTQFDDGLYGQIFNKLGIDKWQNNRWSQAVRCPFKNHQHDDKQPAAHWHNEYNILHCYKCGVNYLTKQVALVLGINISDYVVKNNKDHSEYNYDEENITDTSSIPIAPSVRDLINQYSIDYNSVPVSSYTYTLKDALRHKVDRISGKAVSKYQPIVNPLYAIHHVKGAGLIMKPPFLAGAIGGSSSFKTSLAFMLIYYYSKIMGLNGIVYTPEWTSEKNADRIVQIQGGLTLTEQNILEHNIYAEKYGKESFVQNSVNKNRLNATDGIIRESNEWGGEVVFINQFGSNIFEIIGMVKAAYKEMVAGGITPSYFIFDYIQLSDFPMDAKRLFGVNDVIKQTKVMTGELGLNTWLFSQVTKNDTRQQQDNKKLFNAASGMGVREDEFNLYLSIESTGETVTIDDEEYAVVMLQVLKNSDGRKAMGVDNAITFYAHLPSSFIYQSINEIRGLNPDGSEFVNPLYKMIG